MINAAPGDIERGLHVNDIGVANRDRAITGYRRVLDDKHLAAGRVFAHAETRLLLEPDRLTLRC